MKKLAGLTVMLSVIVASQYSWACDISVTPAKSKVLVGDTVEVKVRVHLIHRKCVLPIEETEVEAVRGTVLSHTDWKKVGRMDYESIYKVVFHASGKNRILVTRECSRVGLSEGSSYVTVTYTLDRATSLAKGYLEKIADGKHVRTNIERLEDVLRWLKSQEQLPNAVKAAIPKIEAVVEANRDVEKAIDMAKAALKCKLFEEKEK